MYFSVGPKEQPQYNLRERQLPFLLSAVVAALDADLLLPSVSGLRWRQHDQGGCSGLGWARGVGGRSSEGSSASTPRGALGVAVWV
jgi:hypothetical protein